MVYLHVEIDKYDILKKYAQNKKRMKNVQKIYKMSKNDKNKSNVYSVDQLNNKYIPFLLHSVSQLLVHLVVAALNLRHVSARAEAIVVSAKTSHDDCIHP